MVTSDYRNASYSAHSTEVIYTPSKRVRKAYVRDSLRKFRGEERGRLNSFPGANIPGF